MVGGAVTVKLRAPLVPFAVLTVSAYVPALAALAIVSVPVSVVEFETLIALGVMLEEFTPIVVPPVRKFVPVSVTLTAVPAVPLLGETDASVGAPSEEAIANITAPLVPPAVVTVTFRLPGAALGEIVNVAVRLVALATVTFATVKIGRAHV